MKDHTPPRFAEYVLKKLISDHVYETQLGDFEEFYSDIAQRKGIKKVGMNLPQLSVSRFKSLVILWIIPKKNGERLVRPLPLEA